MAGIGAIWIALTVLRLVLGIFFVISGAEKLSIHDRHATLVKTLEQDHMKAKLLQWVIPTAEFMGGIALILGFLTPLASGGLMLLCVGATYLDGVKRIPSMHPINRADSLIDFLYLPEVLMVAMLLVLVLGGGGPISFDAILRSM